VLDTYLQLEIISTTSIIGSNHFSLTTHTVMIMRALEFRKILVSIIQGSGICPTSYVVTAFDLHAASPGNSMDKYADDTYLIIPASNEDSCASEIAHIKEWFLDNNQGLNRTKSVERVVVPPRSRRSTVIQPRVVPGFERVESIKALAVTISRTFSVVQHVDELLTDTVHRPCLLCDNTA